MDTAGVTRAAVYVDNAAMVGISRGRVDERAKGSAEAVSAAQKNVKAAGTKVAALTATVCRSVRSV